MTYSTRCHCNQSTSRRPSHSQMYAHHFTGRPHNGMDVGGRPWMRPKRAPTCSAPLYMAWGEALKRLNQTAAAATQCSLYSSS